MTIHFETWHILLLVYCYTIWVIISFWRGEDMEKRWFIVPLFIVWPLMIPFALATTIGITSQNIQVRLKNRTQFKKYCQWVRTQEDE